MAVMGVAIHDAASEAAIVQHEFAVGTLRVIMPGDDLGATFLIASRKKIDAGNL
jgi:hypothetical protein